MSFFRKIGLQAGVQLGMIIDNSGALPVDLSDQRAAVVGYSDRGRLSKVTIVDRSDMRRRLGSPKPIRVSNSIDEVYRHVNFALEKGAQQVLFSRILPDYENQYMIITAGATGSLGQILTEFGDPITDEDGVYLIPEIIANPNLAPDIVIRAYLSPTVPDQVADPLAIVAIKLDDGIVGGFKLRISFDDGNERTPIVDRVFMNLAVLDKDTDAVLYAIKGALSADARDDLGNSVYLPDYADSYADVFSVVRCAYPDADLLDLLESDSASVNGMNVDKAFTLEPFTFTSNTATDIQIRNAVQRLTVRNTEFFYLMGGGTQNLILLRELIDFARRWNKDLFADIPTQLTIEEGVQWLVERDIDPKTYYLSFSHNLTSHLDLLTGNRVRIGMSGYKVGQACARNAIKNDRGLAKKQNAIAGFDYPIELPAMRMEVDLDPVGQGEGYLRDLMARHHINPVLLEAYGSDQSLFVFGDSLTQYASNDKDMKLESVAERSMSVDSQVVGIVKRLQQRNSDDVIADATRLISEFFDDCVGAGWMKPDPIIGDQPYDLVVKETPNRNDSIDVAYTIHYVGTNRQTFVQQTIV